MSVHWMSKASLSSLGVMCFALALYGNSLTGHFVFDDHAAIEVNPDVRSNTALRTVFTNDFWGLPLSAPESHKSYRPLTVLSFRLNHYLHGLWPPGFHIVNITAHGVVCVLYLWSCIGFGVHLAPSLIASLLFASHPIHTEAVANIVGRSEIFAAIYFLMALLAYQRATKTNSMQSLLWVCLAIVLTVIALLCKEQGITALGLCFLWEFISMVKRRQGIKQKNTHTDQTYLPSLRMLILTVAIITILFVRIYLIGGGTPIFIDSDNPASFSPHFQTRFLTYSYICAVNVWLLLNPSNLCHDWSMGSIPLIDSIADIRNIGTLSLALSLCLLSLRVFTKGRKLIWEDNTTVETSHCFVNGHSNINKNHNNNALDDVTMPHAAACSGKRLVTKRKVKFPILHFNYFSLLGLSWTVITFLPAANLFFPVGFVVAERVLYLPSMGFCLLLALGINTLWKERRKLGVTILCVLLVVFSTKTLLRNVEWLDSFSIAQSSLKVNSENAKVHMSMGNELAQKGDRRCELFYREAIRLRPQYASAWANLGLVLINTERALEAEEAYLTALSYKPDHVNANTNMAHLCRLQGRWQEARNYFKTALQRRPKLPTLHYYMGVVSEELGTAQDLEVAEQEYELAVQYNPQHWEAHRRLGRLLAADTLLGSQQIKDRMKKAVFHYKTAVTLKSDVAELHQELGTLLLSLNYTTEAEHHLQEAARLFPSTDSQGHNQPAQDRLPAHSRQERLPRHKEQSRKEHFTKIPKR